MDSTRSPPSLPPRRRLNNPLEPSCSGPRLPFTLLLSQSRSQRPSPISIMASDTTEEENKPLDIKSRMAMFENNGSSSGSGSPSRRPPPIPPRSSAAIAVQGSPTDSTLSEFGAWTRDTKASNNTAPYLRQQQPSSNSPSSASLPISSSPTNHFMTSIQSTGSPHRSSSSLSPVSAHRIAAPHSTTSGSPSSFDLYASSTLRKQASGTSLQEFTSASIARARQQNSTLRNNSADQHSNTTTTTISGKVPLPSSHAQQTSPLPSRRSSPSPATTLNSRSMNSNFYSRTSTSSPHLLATPARNSSPSPSGSASPALPPRHRSSISASSTSSSSSSNRGPLDDDDDDGQRGRGQEGGGGGGYGLSLHPSLQPNTILTASPGSSRAPSRNSHTSRSAPASPKLSNSISNDSAMSSATLRLHPPTPSPERRPIGAEEASPSSSPVNYAVRKKGPALPPRNPTTSAEDPKPSGYTPYTPSTTARRPSGPPSTSVVASKVPLPPGQMTLPPVRIRHNSSHSTGSPTLSDNGQNRNNNHRSTKSGSSFATEREKSLLHPPPLRHQMTRTRSSSLDREKASPSPPSVFHGTRSYQAQQAVKQQSLAPKDEAARKRYESLWTREINRSVKNKKKGVASLTQRFESQNLPTTIPTTTGEEVLSSCRVYKIFKRSKLSDRVLYQMYEAALKFQGGHNKKGLGKEAFVRGVAAIDFELARRQRRS
ncbi:unnamed protein product [Sympodiomycopsis kandeliae]